MNISVEPISSRRPAIGLSLDICNKWSYPMTHGEPGWESFPSSLTLLVPRILGFLEGRDVEIGYVLLGSIALSAVDPECQGLSSPRDGVVGPGGHGLKTTRGTLNPGHPPTAAAARSSPASRGQPATPAAWPARTATGTTTSGAVESRS
jgi:hypothetical protein